MLMTILPCDDEHPHLPHTYTKGHVHYTPYCPGVFPRIPTTRATITYRTPDESHIIRGEN